MNIQPSPNEEKASVVERVTAVIPLAMVTFAYVVSDATANLSPSKNDREYHNNHKDSVLPQMRELAELVFAGKRSPQ
jgi:hypothetical protein